MLIRLYGFVRSIALIGLLSTLCLSAAAANFNFLKDSVLARFSEQDAEEFIAFVAKNLNNTDDKQVAVWQSSHSKLQGKLKVDFSYYSNDMPCRRALFLITDQQRPTERFQFEVCKSKSGWQIQETAARNLTESDWQMQRATGDRALAYPGEGQPFSWRNPKTKNSGVITPLELETVDGQTCRLVAITIFDRKGHSSNGNYLMCQENGEWHRKITAD